MAYQILLVDDELPALRFLQNIIEKYATDYQVAASLFSSEKAYEYLRQHRVDVLITDINMQGMNGIELSRLARTLHPDIRIVIISGYAEFEYAQSAIEAGVDKYLLKPVDIRQMRDTLVRLKMQLDERHASHAAAILPAIACELPFSREDISRYWQGKQFRFAQVHWGGVDPRQRRKLRATSLIDNGETGFYVLRGRCDEEQLLIFPEQDMEQFLTSISVYMVQRGTVQTWTAIYQPSPQPIVMLNSFLQTVFDQLQYQTVVGKHQIVAANPLPSEPQQLTFQSTDLNQMTYFCSIGKFKEVRAMLADMAADLDRRGCTQYQVFGLLKQLALSLVDVLPAMRNHFDQAVNQLTELFLDAASYREVFAEACEVFFAGHERIKERKLSAQELYDYVTRYIHDHYASLLSVQSVCDEIGISQTYLNRLFRRYSDTTFNNCLMRTRMEAAKKLLSEKPGMLLRDVAACVGYEDSSYFSKVFHKYTGQNPSQYATGQK